MTHRIKYNLLLFFALAFGRFLPKTAFASTEEHKGEINVSEFVLEHLADSYEWHITTWGDNHVSIPLPVIVKGETSGWHVFSSERIKEAAKEGKDYQGFSLLSTTTRYMNAFPMVRLLNHGIFLSRKT